MGVINFAGKLPVAVVLQWQGDMVANTPTKVFEPFRYVIANDLVGAFKISVGGATPTTITRTPSPGNKQYDAALNTFTTDPASGPALDDLIAGGSSVPCTIDLTFTYFSFFDVLLQQMTRTDADLHNIANPNDAKAIQSTFTAGIGQRISFAYKPKTERLTGVPCTLRDRSVTPRPGKAPAVKLVFQLDFKPFDDAKREATRKLIAMDWSRLGKFGKAVKEGEKMPPRTEVWWDNRNIWLLNHTDMDRARKFRLAILGRHEKKSAKQIATDLREDIDLHLVTANHWGEEREDAKREPHQHLLSNLFGTLHNDVWLASPVAALRHFDEVVLKNPLVNAPLDLGDYASLALQYGVGHCGEHAAVSFSILSSIVSNTGGPVKVAVRTGNANIDHAFVVYDLTVDLVTITRPTHPKNTRTLEADKTLKVWNLRDAIDANPDRTGFIMDPYLDRTRTKNTAKELLDALHGARRKAEKKNTDWLAFDGEFMMPLNMEKDDIRTLPDNERKGLVPNV